MMYLIYDYDGSILKSNLTEIITQGSTTTKIFVAIKNYPNTTYNALATFKLPNRESSVGDVENSTQVIDDISYLGWLISLTQDETYYYGNLLLSVKIYQDTTTNVLFTMPIELTINKSGYNADETSMTITQYQNLITRIDNAQFTIFNISGTSGTLSEDDLEKYQSLPKQFVVFRVSALHGYEYYYCMNLYTGGRYVCINDNKEKMLVINFATGDWSITSHDLLLYKHTLSMTIPTTEGNIYVKASLMKSSIDPITSMTVNELRASAGIHIMERDGLYPLYLGITPGTPSSSYRFFYIASDGTMTAYHDGTFAYNTTITVNTDNVVEI